MDEAQILARLHRIGAEMAAGQQPRIIFDSILEAVQRLGFDRVRIDLISPDGLSVSPAAMRGFAGDGQPFPVDQDSDLLQLFANPCPQFSGSEGCGSTADATGTRGLLPLVLRGKVIGKLTVESGRAFSYAKLERALLWAHQATIAQAMLWAVSQESLQETTLAITTSVSDRRTLLNTIVEQAVKLLDAKSGGIYEYRPELGDLTLIADFSRPAEYIGKGMKVGQGMAGRLIQDRLPYLMVSDYDSWDGRAEIYGKGRLFGAVLEVPLRWKGRYIGVLYVDDKAGRSFSDVEIRLLQLFADQAAISLTNSNLLLNDEKKLQRLMRLAQSTRELMGNLGGMSLPDRLMLIARSAVEILQAETAGVFRAYDGEIVLEASHGQQGEFEPGKLRLRIHDEPGGGLTGYIAYHGDLFKAKSDELAVHPAAQHSPTHSPTGHCYSLLAIPLKKRTVEGEKLIGLIRVDNKKDEESGRPLNTLEFTAEDESILSIFAEAAAVAIEGAELVERLQEQKDFQERLIDSAPDGIIAVDRKGRVTEFNKRAEEILGYEQAEVLGMPVSPLYVDAKEPYKIGKLLRASKDSQVRDYETAVRSKQGERIPIRHASTWLFDAKGERVGSVGYFADLRSQKALERRERLLLKASDVVTRADSLDEGLQSLTEMMVSLLGRSFCCVLIMDEDGTSLTLRASSRSGEQAWSPGRQQIILAEWPGLAELLEQGEPAIRDASDEKVRPRMEQLSLTLGLDEEIRSLLVVPLKIGPRVVGQIDLGDLYRDAKTAFPPQEIELVSTIASHITILVDRMEVLEKSNRSETLLGALVESSLHIRGEVEMPKLLQGVVRLAAELSNCSVGGLFLNRPYVGQLELAAVHGLPEGMIHRSLSYDDGVIGQVAREGGTIVHTGPQPAGLFPNLKLQTIAAIPLREASGGIEAVLFVGDPNLRIELGRMGRRVLEDFATQTSIALRTSRLIGQEQRFYSQLAILHRISDYIQEADKLEKILLTILTGVTANFGLGFNRAMLLLVDETGEHLVGEMGVGELEQQTAILIWRSLASAKFNDFERFRERLEAGEIMPDTTTVGRRIRGLRLAAGGEDLFSEVIAAKTFRRIGVEEFDRVPQLFLDRFRVTTPIAVAPLIAKGQVIGILVVDNKFTRAPISTESSQALMTFAATAAVAIDNRRLFDQTRSDAEKLVSFYHLSAELIALKDSRQILMRIVDQTVAAAGAAWVSLVLIDESKRALNPIISGRHFSLDPREPFPIRKDGISMQVMQTGEAYAIENVKRMQDKVNRDLMETAVQAAICLPLSLPGKRIGVMWIHYTEPRLFPKSEVAALQLYVNQAAVAYDSARRIEKLEDIRKISDTLAEAEDTQSVLRRIVGGAHQVLKADVTVLWIYDSKTEDFIPEISVHSGENLEAWRELQNSGPQKAGTASRIMARDWISVGDVQDPEWTEIVGPNTRKFLEAIGGQGFQGVALKAGREKLGVLYAIYTKPWWFANEERETAQTFANRAALELKKARLLQQVQRAREAAEVVARVTLLEDPSSTLLSIAREIREALDCGVVVLFKFDQETGTLIPPPAVVGARHSEVSDFSLVLAMVERDGPYIVPDVSRDDRFKNSPFARAEGIKSCVAIPLRAAQRKVGVMFVNYRNPRRFTADELTNIELFANQAAVAIRNAQLFNEGEIKLAQQEALAGLSRELLDAKSVRETMDRAVKFAAKALGMEFCNVVLPDREGRLIFDAAVGWESEMVGTFILDPETGSQTGYTIKTRKPVRVYDYNDLKDFTVPDVVAKHDLRSGLSVPMFRDGEIVGAMLVHTKKPRHFTDDDETLLGLIANQTAIALERARQYEASVRKSAYLAALYDASKAISAQFVLERRQILEQVVQPTMEGITGVQGPKAKLGAIWLYDQDSQDLVLESVYPGEQYTYVVECLGDRWPVQRLQQAGHPIGITGRTVLTGKPQLIKDVKADIDYVECNPDTKSELTVPLLDHNKVIGVLNVESDTLGAFDEEDLEALQALAELVVVAIQNSRQVEELKEARQLVNKQTTLAWMGIGNAIGRHEIARSVGILLNETFNLRKDLKKTGALEGGIAKRLARIKRRLRQDFAIDRLPAGGADEGKKSVLVNDEIIRARRPRIPLTPTGRTLRLEVKCELDDSARVHANALWLQRVLDILINNAVDATEGLPQRKIILGSRSRDSRVEIYVADNGAGIPEPLRDRLLREPVEKPKGAKGLGRGLFIANEIVQIYGGAIGWRDRNPRGTEMWISLPLETPSPKGAGETPRSGAGEGGNGDQSNSAAGR